MDNLHSVFISALSDIRPWYNPVYMKLKRLFITLCLMICTVSSACSTDRTVILPDDIDDGLWNYTKIQGQPVSDFPFGNTFSVSFWLYPEDNFCDSTIFSIGDKENYILLTNRSIYQEIFSGLSLTSHCNGNDYWVIADGNRAPSTGRWNYITVNISQKKAELWMNGEKTAEGPFEHSTKNASMIIGGKPLGFSDIHGKISGFTLNSELLQESEIKRTYEEALAAILLDTVHFPDQDHLDRDLWFDSNTIEDYPLTWRRDPETTLMDDFGRRTSPGTAGNAVFTASLSTENSSAEKQFVFTLAPDNPEEQFQSDLKELDTMVEGTLFSGQLLPESAQNGTHFSYQITEGNAHFDGSQLIKDSNNEKESIRFTVTAENNDLSEVKEYEAVLLDEAYGYLMIYFNGDVDQEVMHFSLSTDGVHWESCAGSDINTRFPVKEDFGTMRLRDPHLSRDENGSFIIAATEGGDHPYIYLYRSDDLLSFDDGHRLLVSYPDDALGMTGEKAWAPEILYDNENQNYLIYYADHRENHGPVYVIYTDLNFEDFTYPQILFDPGYPVIDSTIFPMNGRYWMLYKDERTAAQTIYPAVTDDLSLGFRETYDWKYLHLNRPVEGPIVFKDIHSDIYHVYFDSFSEHTFYVGTFTALDYSSEIDWSDTAELVLPEADVRHGSVMPVTKKEYQRILESYNGEN